MKKFLLSLFVFSLFFTGCSELYNNKSNSELQFNISIPKKLYRSSETGNNPIFTLVLSLDFMENTESQQQTFSVTEGQTISTSFTDIKIGSSVKLSAKVIDENNKVLYEGESPYTIIKTGNNKISLTLKYVGQNNDNTGGSGSGNEGTTDPEQPSTPTEPTTANYTVEFYFENLYDDDYTKKDSLTETKTGNIGEVTNYTPSYTPPGFYHKTKNITISENAENIVKVYYMRNRITLSFDSNGGSTVDDITGKYGATVNLPTAPTKTGYIFEGWYTDENLTNKVEEKLELTEDTKLYAKWTAITYTVQFDANGGDGAMDSQTFTYDINQNLRENTFTRTNYDFDGWNTANDRSGTSYSDEASVINLTSENNGTVTLYAQWEPITWDISYNPNGGTNPENAPTKHTYGTQTLLPIPTNAGHIFAGWFTDSNFKTQISTIDETYILDDNTNHINLYAKWISYSVQLPTYEDIVASFSPGKENQLTITVTIPEGYSIVDWYVNGEKQDTNQNTNQNDFTVSTAAFTEGGGIAAIMVLITDNAGNMYSAEYQITIEK